ncbi:MAG: hypothetical protein QOC92_2376, partial [Acidimicrobiaceae bacterium]
MTGYRRQRVAALEICSTSVAFILLRHVGLLADLPVLTYLGLFAVAGFIGSVATAKFPSGSERDLFLRFATHIGAATTVMYATGWGPALAVGFVYVGCEEIEHTGSKAAGPVLVMTVAGIGAGQVAIAAGMAPSILPYPEVHGLAVLAALGVAFAVRVAASAAAKREEVQADLREREARFRNLVQNISDLVIVIDEAGLLSYASPAAERMLGYDAVSMLGTNVFEIVHPDDRDRVVEIFLETLEEGPGVKGLLDLRVAHTDGRWVHVEVIGNIVVSDGVLEGYVITVRDVTERAEASEALRVSEERYRVLLNALNEGVAVVCRDGTMLACNDIGQEMLGLGPAGVTEFQNIHDYDPEIYDEDGEEIPRDERPMARAFQTGCEARATVRMRRRDGCLVWLDLRAVPMPGDAHGHQVVVSAVDITVRKEAEHALARQATHDPLTGLPNRTLLYDRISQALARRSRLPGDLAVMFLDVDRFKWLNDSLGHAAGDAVLVEVAARLQSAVRDTDTVARFGGDEFVVLCEDMASEEQAMLLARHLSECVSFPIELGATEMTPSVSIGLVIASAVVDAGPDALLRDADAAMYTAKERGRGGRELFDSGTHARTAERHEAERALRRAIDRGELRVHYQPEVDLS